MTKWQGSFKLHEKYVQSFLRIPEGIEQIILALVNLPLMFIGIRIFLGWELTEKRWLVVRRWSRTLSCWHRFILVAEDLSAGIIRTIEGTVDILFIPSGYRTQWTLNYFLKLIAANSKWKINPIEIEGMIRK